MLMLYSRISAKDIPGPYGLPANYTLFSDSDSPKTYYLLPEMPTFLPNMKKTGPAFNMLWYYGTGQEAGGVCTFTVALPMPNLTDPQVLKLLNQAITQDLSAQDRAQKLYNMAQAHNAGNETVAEDLRKALGLTPEQAKQIYAGYDSKQDWVQYLPTDQSLQIKPVAFTKSHVIVYGFGGQEAFQQWNKNGDPNQATFTGVYEANSSKIGENAAVISFDLTEKGVNLFWQALGGPPFSQMDKSTGGESVVAVVYSVEFDALLPAATATVTLHHEAVAQILTTQRSQSAGWGKENTWTEVTGKQHQDTIKNSIKIEVPASSYLNTPEGKKNIADMLQEWAQKQLESMLQAQLPNVSLDQVGTGTLDPKQISAIHDDNRSYELSEAIHFEANPQGQLSKIPGLTKDNLQNYFQTIDLNKTPSFNVCVVINGPLPSMMKKHNVDSVIITQINFANQNLIDQDKKPVTSLVFNAGDTGQQTVPLTGTFDRKQSKILTYSYRVNYSDDTPPFERKNIQLKPEDGYVISFAPCDLGVLSVHINGEFLPWNILDHVDVDLQYNTITDKVRLTNTRQSMQYISPINEKLDTGKLLNYKATFYLTDHGAPLSYPLDGKSYAGKKLSGSPEIDLPFPLSEDTNTYIFYMDDTVTNATLSVEYAVPLGNISGAVYTFKKGILLNRNITSVKWEVPAPKDGQTVLRINNATITGIDAQSPKHELAGQITLDASKNNITVSYNEIKGF